MGFIVLIWQEYGEAVMSRYVDQMRPFDSQLPESVRNRDLVLYQRRDSCTIVYSFGGMFGMLLLLLFCLES